MTPATADDGLIETPLKENKSGQFEYTVPRDFAAEHGIEDTVLYELTTRWTDAGRPTTIALNVRAFEDKETNTRSAIQHPNGTTIRLPNYFAAERGLDDRLEAHDESQGEDEEPPVTLYLFGNSNSDSGAEGFQLVFDEPFEEISTLDPVQNVLSMDGFSTKKDGPNHEYTGYRLVMPMEYSREYGLETEGHARWSLAIYQGRIAVVLEFVDGDRDEFRSDPTVTLWKAYEAGDVDEEKSYVVPQVQLMVPRVLATSLGWQETGMQVFPEEDRIVFVPDQGGTSRDAVNS